MMLLEGTVQAYAWGSHDAIPALLGIEPTGEPHAELWLGAHPKSPSTLPEQQADLLRVINAHPELLGTRSVEQFGPTLPFMMKVLSASQPLSLQAHPNRAQAEAGFDAENAAGVSLDDPRRSFKDPWPKPEMAVALTPFSTLSGFRPACQTADLLEKLDAGPELNPVIGALKNRVGEAALAEVFLVALSLAEQHQGLVDQVVAAALRHVDDRGELGVFARTAIELDEHFPGDPGILAGLLLNRLDLEPGHAVFMNPGNMHAHLKGTCIEIMASSDNVLRAGLTQKHIDVDGLVQVVEFVGQPTMLVDPVTEAPGLSRYPTPSPEFALWHIELGRGASSNEPLLLPASEGARILLVEDGYLACSGADETVEVVKGRSLFIPAGEVVRVNGDAVAWLAAAGIYAGA
ncbi:mannose-6-phosphate isomerase, class I [Propionibacteriaceae bacterium G1746]|uniref:mannose-6-phosphate isomerase, class I n=1 Tax=Aestuariimicrobium sp. G57 TaxID=3418485 RepID=UPI003C20B09E